MEQPVDQFLDRRYHPDTRRRRLFAVVVSVVLHLTLAAAFVVAPVLAARRRPPIEFVPIRIVPVQALGSPEAPPPAPKPEVRRPAPPPPESKPKPTPKPVTPPPPQEVPARRPPETRPSEPPTAAPAATDDAAGQRLGSPTGSATGTSPFGGAIAGLDNPDFIYSYYIDQMLALIGAHWIRPPSSSGVEAIIRFRIGRQGEVTELELLNSSGLSAFDFAGLRAVRSAAPLPPLPRSYPHDSLGIRLVIR